ncbi:integrase/recombinase XerD [Pedobacter sp. CG_S7]|uniref:site-specific integrase n=1 Tax=Pedobacter sp. CG_S7 TaxID=3143930 RepID=UPI003396E6B1
MKPTNFARYLSDFIARYLISEKGASKNTVAAYRDAFILLIRYMEEVEKLKVEKLELNHITKETVLGFLDWLQVERKCGSSTRNARLAAIHSFYSYLQHESIEYLHESQRILSVKFKKKPKETITYLTLEGIKILLEQANITTRRGRRDLALLSLMYDTGSRVQEIIDLTPANLHLTSPATVTVMGKGNKARLIPMLDIQTEHLKAYLRENKLEDRSASLYPLFSNSKGEKLTRAGVAHILKKYVEAARNKDVLLVPEKLSCHSLRHSKAMHLLQAGVNLIYIRDILGHVSIQTTEIYARADSKQKREALEKAYVNVNPEEKPRWESNESLIDWLKNF